MERINQIKEKLESTLHIFLSNLNSHIPTSIRKGDINSMKIVCDTFFMLFDIKKIISSVDLEDSTAEIDKNYLKLLGYLENYLTDHQCMDFFYLQNHIDGTSEKTFFPKETMVQINNFEMLACMAKAIDSVEYDIEIGVNSTFMENFLVKPKYLRFAVQKTKTYFSPDLFNLVTMLTASSLLTASFWIKYNEMFPSSGFRTEYFINMFREWNSFNIEEISNLNLPILTYLIWSHWKLKGNSNFNKKEIVIDLLNSKITAENLINYDLENLAYILINTRHIENYYQIVESIFVEKFLTLDDNRMILVNFSKVPQVLRAAITVLLEYEEASEIGNLLYNSIENLSVYKIFSELFDDKNIFRDPFEDPSEKTSAKKTMQQWSDPDIRRHICDIFLNKAQISEYAKAELISSSTTSHGPTEISDLELHLDENRTIHFPIKSYKEGNKKSVGTPHLKDQYLKPFLQEGTYCVIIISIKPLSPPLLDKIHDFRHKFKIPILYLADESLLRFMYNLKPELFPK